MKLAKTYYDVKGCDSRIQIHQGGTRSGKTYSILTCLVELCYRNQNGGAVITICRKTGPALRATAYRDFMEILERENLYSEEFHRKSDNGYVLFGNYIEFVSIDEPQKIRGRKRDILFVNEANELSLEDWRQLLMRTSLKVIIDYNPSDEYHWIYEEVIPRDDASFFKSTYKDNPFLDDELVAEIERLKETDENYWRIYGLGERGVNTAAVFPNWTEVEEVPARAKLLAYGLDWGFTNDPTCVIAVYHEDNSLYFEELMYQTGLHNAEIAEKIDHLREERATIIADSAEPKSIDELYRLGFNIKGAKKGPDSIRMGIDLMRRHKLHVVSSSTNVVKEFRNYRWEQDRMGHNLNRPVDKDNHAIDSIRYVCLYALQQPYSGKYYLA